VIFSLALLPFTFGDLEISERNVEVFGGKLWIWAEPDFVEGTYPMPGRGERIAKWFGVSVRRQTVRAGGIKNPPAVRDKFIIVTLWPYLILLAITHDCWLMTIG
jgi:hypothetical protein